MTTQCFTVKSGVGRCSLMINVAMKTKVGACDLEPSF